MIAIIAEKPSLARNIVAGIGEMKKRNGYFENSDYIVTWAFGHLFSLADVEAYGSNEGGRWTLDNLPCFPEQFKFELKKNDGKVDSGLVYTFCQPQKKYFIVAKELGDASEGILGSNVVGLVDATGKVTGLVADESQASRLTTDADGMLSIIGLPSGTHHFKEVVAPSGYNVLTTEIAVTITAAADATTGKLTSFKGEATGTARPVIVDMEKGDLLVTVENRIGSTLPETGGIGTTIFYVAGIALMLGAVAVIMAKKRSGESK